MIINRAVWLFGRRGVAPLRPARILGFANSIHRNARGQQVLNLSST